MRMQDKDLIYWAKQGNLERVEGCLNCGEDIDVQDKHKKTALISAINAGAWNVVRYLVDQKANLNLVDENGMTALCYVIEKYYLNMAGYFLDSGAKTNVIKAENPLMFAAGGNDLKIARLLVHYGCEINQHLSYTPLINAVINQADPEMIGFLLENGADISIKDSEGRTAMDIAKANGNDVAIELLNRAIEKDSLDALIVDIEKTKTIEF